MTVLEKVTGLAMVRLGVPLSRFTWPLKVSAPVLTASPSVVSALILKLFVNVRGYMLSEESAPPVNVTRPAPRALLIAICNVPPASMVPPE